MPQISVARTIIVVSFPEASRDLIRDGQLKEAVDPGLFDGEEEGPMAEVHGFVHELTDSQAGLLLLAMQHAIDEDQGHGATAHFLQLDSTHEVQGVGLEIRNDTILEENVFSPIRVMFVRWEPPES